jgi:hypothetical protein
MKTMQMKTTFWTALLAVGISVQSANAGIPTLVSAETSGNPNGLTVTFSEDVEATTATTLANYSINNGVTVTGAILSVNPNIVRLTTSTIAEGSAYTLTVTGVVSVATAEEIAPGSTNVFVQAQGLLTRNVFYHLNTASPTISTLTNLSTFPNSPDVVGTVANFEAPANDADQFGDRIYGYVTAPVSGDYVFYISSTGPSELYLSPTTDPAGKVLICSDPGNNGQNAWLNGANQAGRGSPASNISGTNVLVAGQRYYIEARRVAPINADRLGVTWHIPGTPDVVDGDPTIRGRYLSTLKTTGPVTITTPPASQTVQDSRPVTFTVVADGTPNYTYQWYNGVNPVGGNSPTYTIPHATLADNGAQISVAVSNAFSGIVSGSAILTVTNDITKPVLLSASGGATPYTASVTFSEFVDPTTAANPANYGLSGGLTVGAATVAADGTNVVLTTSKQVEGSNYVVTVSGVQDYSTANTIVAASTANFRSWVFSPGFVQLDYYSNLVGTAVSDLTAIPAYPLHPDNIRYLVASAEFFPVLAESQMYGVRMSGYITPAVDGDHFFYISSFNEGQLFVSTDDTQANLSPSAASAGGLSILREWVTDGNPRSLFATNRYYMEALSKMNSGFNGHVGVSLQSPGEPAVANLSPSRLKGSLMGVYADPVGKLVVITNQPQNQTKGQGSSATFSVAAAVTPAGSPIFYQWQSNSVDIVGANSSSYTTQPLLLAQSGDQYRCRVGIPGYATNSVQASVNVTTDVTPPTLVSTATLTNSLRVGVLFNEVLDPASVTNLANYTVSGGATVTNATLMTNGAVGVEYALRAVALGLDVPVAGSTVTVTVSNVKDISGNTIAASSSVIGKVANLTAVNIGNNTSPNPFTATPGAYDDLVSGGNFSGSSDAGFRYDCFEVTGDFDVRVQVAEYPSLTAFAKAGIMHRLSLAANSPYFSSTINPPNGSSHVYAVANRATTGVNTVAVPAVAYPAGALPQWLRLQRVGNVVKSYYSVDGNSWTNLGTDTLAAEWVGVSPTYVGLCGTSRSASAVDRVSYRYFGETPMSSLAAAPDGTGKAKISWTGGGTLQQSGVVTGPYTNAPVQTNPQTNTPSGPAMFYRGSAVLF